MAAPPIHFEESDLHFTFPGEWMVRKFDGTDAYQSLSGRGLKGVDFIAISPDDRLWLIEVKNFLPRNKGGKEYRATRRSPELLADQVVKKFRDSVRLIRIVEAHLGRSLYARIIVWYRKNVRRSRRSNYWFWHRCHQLCQAAESGGHRIEYVAWTETPEDNNDYDVRLYAELRNRMHAEDSITVAERDYPQSIPIVVSYE